METESGPNDKRPGETGPSKTDGFGFDRYSVEALQGLILALIEGGSWPVGSHGIGNSRYTFRASEEMVSSYSPWPKIKVALTLRKRKACPFHCQPPILHPAPMGRKPLRDPVVVQMAIGDLSKSYGNSVKPSAEQMRHDGPAVDLPTRQSQTREGGSRAKDAERKLPSKSASQTSEISQAKGDY